jgi:hypothetical protein
MQPKAMRQILSLIKSLKHSKSRVSLENGVLVAGVLVFIFILSLPRPIINNKITYQNSLEIASLALKFQANDGDIAQDMLGFRALVWRQDPYPILGPAFLQQLGINWNVPCASTHPPTAFLLAAPVAFFPWKIASGLWAYLMVIGIFASYRLYGFSWKYAVGLTPITLLWPPAALSLGQITVPILFLLALGYRLRKRPFFCGMAIGLSFVIKFFPGLLILPFLSHKNYRAVLGFLTSVGLTGLMVLGLNPEAFSRYLEVNKTNSIDIVLQSPFNGSIFSTLLRDIRIPGLLLAVLFFVLLAFHNRSKILGDPEHDDGTWLFLNYLSVALLPISWNYSLLPLLPLIIWLFKQGKPILVIICISGLILSSIAPYGGESAAGVALSVVVFGISQIRLPGLHGDQLSLQKAISAES